MKKIASTLLLALALSRFASAQPLAFSKFFASNMVLQRDTQVPVWGWANPGEQVTVTFAGQSKTAVADGTGRWEIKLDSMAANAAGTNLVATGSSTTLTITNVLVGDVWLASGQSNMGVSLQTSTGGTDELAAISASMDAALRFGELWPQAYADTPSPDLPASNPRPLSLVSSGTNPPKFKWTLADTTNAQSFSAVACYFARGLRTNLGVPIGIIKDAVASSACQAWTPQWTLESTSELLTYITDWNAKNPTPPTPQSAAQPFTLFNGSIYPLMPMAIKGVIWYQGEANTNDSERYQKSFPAMIGAWREGFRNPNMPFLFVQLTPYTGTKPEIREAQAYAAKVVANSAMVVTLDVGDVDPTQIHPPNKKPVGERLALKALALVYGRNVEHSSPEYLSHQVSGSTLTVSFSHADGLTAAVGSVSGFELAGSNGTYYAATGQILGSSVVLNSANVAAPVTVRYSWANVPSGNLFNSIGLPAAPFRTQATADPSFATWIATQSGISGKTAPGDDPDGDGVPNLLEFALNGNPGSALSAPQTTFTLVSGTRQLSFNRVRSDLVYEIQASDDLLSWTTLANNPGTFTVSSPNLAPIVFSDNTPKARRFLRLQVRTPPVGLRTRQKFSLVTSGFASPASQRPHRRKVRTINSNVTRTWEASLPCSSPSDPARISCWDDRPEQGREPSPAKQELVPYRP